MSDSLLVQNCAPTLAGLKSGSLFCCPYRSREELHREVRRLNRSLGPKGIRIMPLRYSQTKALIYVYRPKDLCRDLADHEATRLLAEAGYESCRPEFCLMELRRRLSLRQDFPHEIGLFLSYPPEDVRGFIDNGAARCKCCGYWKVYGDEERARRLFRRYRQCSQALWKVWERGVPVEKLAVAS